jgi:hypothetical protein
MAKKNQDPLAWVAVATGRRGDAACMAGFLLKRGVISAIKPVKRGVVEVKVHHGNKARAEKLLEKWTWSDCGGSAPKN